MLSGIRTFALVTIITVLIWAFAEAESLTTKVLRFELLFTADPQTRLFADPADVQGWTGRVEVTIEGSNRAVGDVEFNLRRGVSIRPGMSGIPTEPGEYSIDLNQVLRAAPEIVNRGVTIAKVDPPILLVVVDTLVTRELQVIADAQGALVDGPVECRPSNARITLPRSLSLLLPADIALTARIPQETIGSLVPGRSETIAGIPILPPPQVRGRPRVTIEPERADAVLTLRTRTDSFTITSVPVHVKVAAGEYGRWDITIPDEDRFIRDVTVSGPSDMVARVRRGEIRLTAVLTLSFDELERGISSKDVLFSEVPTELKFETDRTTVRLRIARRADPAALPSDD
ncbi:MAG: hypothetical protein KF787_12015 [Phycisphaeraceae bacterium]|nr:hypothetical protein [Phycisphaerae bacterium]MBX3393361.1 hypothetical protein [Phycisphaeraceae bacterium]HRJ49461.1 hypothetical protein [Phycisphaerales bacterium]